MNTKIILIIIISFLSSVHYISAQDKEQITPTKSFIVETSFNFQYYTSRDFDFIRANQSSVHYYGGQNFYTNFNVMQNGARYEFKMKNPHFAFSTGIRYTRLTNELYSNYPDNYFYILLSQTDEATKYVRVNGIYQYSNYIGIPLEVRYFLIKDSKFNPFTKFGMDFSYNVSTNENVDFFDDNMQKYESQVLDKFDPASSFYSTAYLTTGIMIRFSQQLRFNFDIKLPFFTISEKKSTFYELNSGFGVGINFGLQYSFK